MITAEQLEGYFIRINNRNNFLMKEIPNLHPESLEYIKYWKKQKKRCIEGFWSIDDANVDVHHNGINSDYQLDELYADTNKYDGKWRFMTPNLYFYVNAGTITHVKKGSQKTTAKQLIRPDLRDFEWEYLYNWFECRGFSGFKDDDEYSCNNELHEFIIGERTTLDPDCINSKGEPKKYIKAREYLRMLHKKPLGLPIYNNQAKNLILMSTRDLGKSMCTAVGIILHEFLTDGAKEYTEETIKHPFKVTIFVGAAITDKSTDLLDKFKDAKEHLPGQWAVGTLEFKPSPLDKQTSGTLGPNNKKNAFRHEYDFKVGDNWIKKGSRSSIQHGIFTTDNPEAAAGTRPTMIVIEETGLLPNALAVHGCYAKGTKIRMYDGTLCNVEDITLDSEIMGHDGSIRTVKDVFNGTDQLYKIKQASGVEYVINSKHKLYLEQYSNDKDDGFYTISAEDFYNNKLKKSQKKRKGTYVLKSGLIHFDNPKPLKLDPYYMGLWLGDGIVKSCGICYDPKTDINTQEWLINYYRSMGLSYSLRDVKGAILCSPICDSGKQGLNHIRRALKEYGTYFTKFLHEDYQLASEEDRLKLLAGMIDADGTLLNKNNTDYKYTIYQSGRKDLVDKLTFIARSLGFRVNVCTHHDKRKSHYKERHQISITGDIGRIPCKHPRKQVPKDYKVVRSSVRSGFKLEKLEVGEYYGFELNEDFRFLGEDNRICENSNAAALNRGAWKFGSALYIGTGGNVEKVQDSEKLFRDPDGFDMLAIDDIFENTGKMGFFVPAIYAPNEFKDDNGNTDVEAALEFFLKKRAKAKKANDPSAINMEMMNYPLMPSEMFLNATGAMFPQAMIKEHLATILANPHRYHNASYFGDLTVGTDGIVKWINGTDHQLVTDWPIKHNKDKLGCIQIWEMPQKDAGGNVFRNRYIQGTDTYDDDESSTTSLGSTFIMDLYTNRIVAEYTGRPKSTEFYERCRMLNIFYSAEHNYENNKKGLFMWYDRKNSLHLLCDNPSYLKGQMDITIHKEGNKSKGTDGNKAVNAHGLSSQLDWMLEQADGQNEGVLNLHMIKSVGYLKECLSFNKDGNFDRISAMNMVCILRNQRIKFLHKAQEERVKDLSKDNFFERNYNRLFKYIR